MKRLLFYFLTCSWAVPSASQVMHGSIGVVYFAQDKIVVAAESRLLPGGVRSSTAPTDNGCKVTAVDGKLVFISAGMTKRVGDSTSAGWDNSDLIREAYYKTNSKSRHGEGILAETARVWSDAVAEKFNADNQRHPGLFRWLMSQMAPGEAFTAAYMGGRDEAGNLRLFFMSVNPTASGLRAEGSAKPVLVCRDHGFCAVGAALNAVREFANTSSERARKEWSEWKPPKGTTPRDHDAFKTIHIVELAVLDHASNDAGGPVDAVQLNRDSSSHWYARKSTCPQN